MILTTQDKRYFIDSTNQKIIDGAVSFIEDYIIPEFQELHHLFGFNSMRKIIYEDSDIPECYNFAMVREAAEISWIMELYAIKVPKYKEHKGFIFQMTFSDED